MNLQLEIQASLMTLKVQVCSACHRWRFGSIAERVLRRCERPVLIARSGA